MAKPRPVIDQKAIDRMLKQGRGRGTHEKYKPWLTVRDVPSLGKSSRDKGWKTGRPHHFLSILELLYYLILILLANETKSGMWDDPTKRPSS